MWRLVQSWRRLGRFPSETFRRGECVEGGGVGGCSLLLSKAVRSRSVTEFGSDRVQDLPTWLLRRTSRVEQQPHVEQCLYLAVACRRKGVGKVLEKDSFILVPVAGGGRQEQDRRRKRRTDCRTGAWRLAGLARHSQKDREDRPELAAPSSQIGGRRTVHEPRLDCTSSVMSCHVHVYDSYE